MFYLISKFAVLFLLACVFGFLLGRWWTKRQYVDVTDIHEALSRTSIAMQNTPWEQVLERFDALKPMINEILHHELDTQLKIDLGAMASQLNIMEAKLMQMSSAKGIELTPLVTQLKRIEKQFGNLQPPSSQAVEAVRPQLSSLMQMLETTVQSSTDKAEAFENLMHRLERMMHTAHVLEPAALERMGLRMEHVESMLSKQGGHDASDNTPLAERISALEKLLADVPTNIAGATTGLDQLELRMESLEQVLSQLSSGEGRKAAHLRIDAKDKQGQQNDTMVVNSANQGDGPLLLGSEQYGAKDDLKRIFGVGPKLESLLNEQGIYYFWQISGWEEEDIKAVDERLEVFKGRIERDGWVSQADRLKREPGSAHEPAK